ncbi:hypothetical protein RRG08_051849 [Elysia crispata]|uniref:F-box domain-containing protein n=1 Tax=Elysia crispata TaxID=231223 RepID=A0AAE1DCT0_9GAST|nr:hypothetical protein RRG08_051849 [Elysia crispata]
MKLRVKLQRQSQVIDFEQREPSTVTFSELKSVVSSRFGLEDHDFELSLNKTDALPSGDETLSSLGIVSGDLLHIIGSNLPQASPVRNDSQRPQPLGSWSSSETAEPASQRSDISMITVASSSSDPEQRKDNTNMDNQDNGQSSQDPNVDVQINRFLLEPLVVRESTATQVPLLLEQLYLSATCNCVADAVWVAVHTLMLETGFVPQQNSDVAQIPPGWKQSGFYKCVYNLHFPGKEPGECTVVGVPMVSSLIVHGLTKPEGTFKTEHLQLTTSHFVTSLSENVPSVYVGLDRLSRQFKDTICLPLQNELAKAAGVPGGHGFTSLPYEIKIRIMSSLDAVSLCHVAQTGLDFSILAKDKAVWRRIYIRDFGKPENSELNRDWYEIYKEECIQRRERERRRREFRLDHADPFFGFPGGLRPFPNPGMRFPPFPPHIVGGDYDLNPEFAAGGIPNPMGTGQARRPGPILPNVGIPDPFGGDPLGLGGMGGRPGRGNLTGSPFSGGGRGNLFRSPFM